MLWGPCAFDRQVVLLVFFKIFIDERFNPQGRASVPMAQSEGLLRSFTSFPSVPSIIPPIALYRDSSTCHQKYLHIISSLIGVIVSNLALLFLQELFTQPSQEDGFCDLIWYTEYRNSQVLYFRTMPHVQTAQKEVQCEGHEVS